MIVDVAHHGSGERARRTQSERRIQGMPDSVDATEPQAAVDVAEPKPRPSMRHDDPTIHRWYHSVMAFPDHLVDWILDELAVPAGTTVTDPHCGSGTTLVQAQGRGLLAQGLDANPVSVLASEVKTDWSLNYVSLRRAVASFDEDLSQADEPVNTLDADPTMVYLRDSGMLDRGWIRTDVARDAVAVKRVILRIADRSVRKFLLLGLVACVLEDLADVRFGPELYCVAPRDPAPRAKDALRERLSLMLGDYQVTEPLRRRRVVRVRLGDSRDGRSLRSLRWPESPSVVITSPPYPTEHDYTRNSRLELAFIEAVTDLASLRSIKKRMIRSHSKGIYVGDNDARFVRSSEMVQTLRSAIVSAVGEGASGFAGQYPKVVTNYFGGLVRHLKGIARHLHPGSRLVYVLGDQASYANVFIPTADVFVQLTKALVPELNVDGSEPWRTRRATAGSHELWEHVVFLTRR